MRGLLGIACVLVLAVACGDDPVSVSEPVILNLKAKSGDTMNGTVEAKKGVTTESGNPYGKFIGTAKDRLGRDPGRVEVDFVTLLLGGQSTGVTALEEIFTGKVEILFVMDSGDNSYPVAHVMNPAGTQANLSVDFTGMIAAGDWQGFLGGSFKIVIRGPAAAGFESKGAEADLQVALNFSAYE